MNAILKYFAIGRSAFLPMFFLILIVTLNCSDSEKTKPARASKPRRIKMIGSLLKVITKVVPPPYKPAIQEPVVILKGFEPIPNDAPDLTQKVSSFSATVNYWGVNDWNNVIKSVHENGIWDDTAYRFLMHAHVMRRQYSEALAFGGKIKEPDQHILRALGICALQSNKFEEAISYFKKLEEEDRAFAEEQIGNVYFKQAVDSSGNLKGREALKQAIGHWEQARGLPGSSPYLSYAIGVSYFLIGDNDRAREHFRKLYEEEGEPKLQTRLFMLLSLPRQGKELNEVLDRMIIESDSQSAEARDLLKVVIAAYYFLGEDQYDNGQVEEARKYWRKARTELRRYDFRSFDNLEFLYLKAIIYQMLEETKEETGVDSVDNRNLATSAFGELLDTLAAQKDWQPKFDDYTENIGDILYLLEEKDLSLQFYKLIRNPNVRTKSKLCALDPKTQLSLKDLKNLPLSRYSFFTALNFAHTLLQDSLYYQAPEIIDELLRHKVSISASESKISDALLLEFSDSLRVRSTNYYDDLYAKLNLQKSQQHQGRQTIVIDAELTRVLQERELLAKKLLQVQNSIAKPLTGDWHDYIFISADSARTGHAEIIIFPKMDSTRLAQ